MISVFISSAYNSDIFKTNTCASFKNRLPRLEDAVQPTDRRNRAITSYSISMTDLWYPSMVMNVSETGNEITLVRIDKDETLLKFQYKQNFIRPFSL